MKDRNSTRFRISRGKYSALTMSRNDHSKEEAIYWGSDADFGVLSLTEAQELIEVLQAIINDYPKEPSNEEILNELPVGSVVQFDDDDGRWVRTPEGILLTDGTDLTGHDLSIYEGLKITVKYRGDE
jgi:hypothetical protein